MWLDDVRQGFARGSHNLMQMVAALVISLFVAAPCSWCAENVFADQLAALRSLPDATHTWTQKDDKAPKPHIQSFLSKGRFFHFDTGIGEVRAYSSRGFQLLRKWDGLMFVEKDPVAPAKPVMKRGMWVPAILHPVKFLGMVDGDPGDVGLVWSDVFNDKYLASQVASLVSKTVPDDKGGWWVTIPYKTSGVKNGKGVFDFLGYFLHVHIEPVAACRQARLVTRIEYTNDSKNILSVREFTYDLVTSLDKRQFPMLKSGRWTSPDGATVYETLERTGVELGKEIADDEIGIDPVLAKQIKDVTSGLIFYPDQ